MPIQKITQAEIEEIFGDGLILFGRHSVRSKTLLNEPINSSEYEVANFMDSVNKEEIESVTRVTKLISRRIG
jgi:hypothetical protein